MVDRFPLYSFGDKYLFIAIVIAIVVIQHGSLSAAGDNEQFYVP